MKKKPFFYIVALLVVIGVTFGVSAAEAATDLVFGVPDTFISMDPHDTNDNLSYSAEKTMMQGLLGFDKDMKIVPLLAESYEANPQATVFIFKLRKGIKFHDGTDFNADAVKVNVERLANPENKLKRHTLFAMVSKVEVVDDYTVVVRLKEPFGAMLNNFAHPCALMHSPKALKEKGKEVARHPVGTGPFMFDKWVPGSYLRVVKNRNYWRPGYPRVDSITFKPTPENSTRIAMLRTGEADFIYPVPPEQAPVLKKQKNIDLVATPSIIVDYLSMNTMAKPFDDVRVRKAINYAVDKDAYIKIVRGGFSDVADSIIAPKVQYYSKQKPYPYNLKEARRLMKEAGYEKGFSTEVWGSNNSATIKGMEFMQQQLAQLNIKVAVVPMESGTRSHRIWSVQSPEDAEIRLYLAGWSPSTGDADWGIRPLFSGDSFPPTSFNTAYYKNEKVDELIRAAIATADPKRRMALYAEIQSLIWEDTPWVFLTVRQNLVGVGARLKGVYMQADGILSAEEAEVVK